MYSFVPSILREHNLLQISNYKNMSYQMFELCQSILVSCNMLVKYSLFSFGNKFFPEQ